MRYRRANTAGGTYFFTVNLADRRSDLLIRHIDNLRAVMRAVKQARPFTSMAMVILPEHLHALWRLPDGDIEYPMRWSLLKAGFSRWTGVVKPMKRRGDMASVEMLGYTLFSPTYRP